jgi:hypothetical protein
MTPAVIYPSEREKSEMREPDPSGRRRTRARSLNLLDPRCPGCGVVKPLEEFTRDRSKPSGFGTYCLTCDRERSRAYYERNRARILEDRASKRGPQSERFCSECQKRLEGRQRVTCGSRRCREARFRKLQPASYAERERLKVIRRKERRRELRETAGQPKGD